MGSALDRIIFPAPLSLLHIELFRWTITIVRTDTCFVLGGKQPDFGIDGRLVDIETTIYERTRNRIRG